MKTIKMRYVASVGFTFYKIAKLINGKSNIELHVFMTSTEMKKAGNDFDFKESWVHEIPDNVLNIRNLLKGHFWKKEFPKADLYLLTDSALLFASAPRNFKSVFLPIGFDLTEQPFVEYSIRRGKRIREKAKLSLLSIIQGRRIKKVDEVWCSAFKVFTLSLEKLGYSNRVESFVPFPINFEAHKSGADISFFEKNAEFTIFFPGRVMTTKSNHDLQSGQTKGAEIAAQGFIDFTKLVDLNVELVIVDNSSSPDTTQLKKIFKDNEVDHLVRWISPNSEIGRISSEQMGNIYSLSDVILGDFGSSWFGQTAIESGFHGKPFISKMDSKFMINYFQGNPFCIAENSSQISSTLLELYESDLTRALFGARMNDWYRRFFDEHSVESWYLNQFERILESDNS